MPIPKILRHHQILLGLTFGASLLFIMGNFLMNLSFPDSSYNFLAGTRDVRMEPEKPVTQTFIAKENHLNQVKVIIGNLNLWPGEKIVFELADPSCTEVIADASYRFFNLNPHIYYRFNFPEIIDSAGKTYCLRITYFSPFDRGGDSPFVEATSGDEEAFAGWSYYDGRRDQVYENRTLKMRPAYGTGSLWGDLQMLNNRLSQYKPEFTKGMVLPLLILFLFATSILAYHIIRSDEKRS